MLRKRGTDAGPRASWAFSLGGLADALADDNDHIMAIRKPVTLTDTEEITPAVSPTANADSPLDHHQEEEAHLLNLAPSSPEQPVANRMLEAVDVAVDAAATQLMSKALRLMSIDSHSHSNSRSGGDMNSSSLRTNTNKSSTTTTTTTTTTGVATAGGGGPSPLLKFDSSSFLDKGLDAINGMGRLVEGFAVTLDTVIGQAFEDWGTPNAPGREGKKKIVKPIGILPARKTSAVTVQRQEKDSEWGDFDIDDQEGTFIGRSSSFNLSQNEEDGDVVGEAAAMGQKKKSVTTPLRSFPGAPAASPPSASQSHYSTFYTPTAPSSQPRNTTATTTTTARGSKEVLQWRRRAQILQKELQKLRAQRDEYQKVKEEYEVLQQQLRSTNNEGTTGASSMTSIPLPLDPLVAEQVTLQMEALLEEKARLAQENDRLLRENSGLHELLDFTMQQHASVLGEDELFGGSSVSTGGDGSDVGYAPSLSSPEKSTIEEDEVDEVHDMN